MIERDLAPRLGQSRPVGKGYRRLLLLLGVWGLLIGAVQLYAHERMITLLDVLRELIMLCHSSVFGPLIFIGAAALSPLLLIPAALLGSVAGLCFGPLLGVVYTLIGCNLSATLTYTLGRCSACDMGATSGPGRMIARYGSRIQRNSFLSVLLLRLSFLPYDPVNYLIGLLRVSWPRFMLANTLGSLPGVVAIVLAGASVEGLDKGLPMVNTTILAGAAALLLLSAGLAYVIGRRSGE